MKHFRFCRLNCNFRGKVISSVMLFIVNVIPSFLRDTDLAEAINDSFSNVASDILPLEFAPIPVHYTPDEYIISPEAAVRSQLAIKERKSCGPDEIPNWVLKNFAPILCRPVCSIFNSSISQAHVPSLWKCANVLPLGKVPQPRSIDSCLLYTSPSPRDLSTSRMPSSA